MAFLGLLLVVSRAFAAPKPATDPETENRFRADVAAVSVEAAAAYDEGNAARDAERAADAIAAYRRAIELAPAVDHPHRRLCWALQATGDIDEGVAECELALSLAPSSPYDKSALAVALLGRGRPDDKGRCNDLAREAAEALPRDVTVTAIWCMVTLQTGNNVSFAKCSRRLLELDPDGAQSNMFAAIVAGDSGDFGEAHHLLGKAKEAGIDPAAYDNLKSALEAAEATVSEPIIDVDAYLEPGLLTLGIWALVLLLLFAAGNSLSRSTLQTAERGDALEASGSSHERLLRKIYKAVLGLAGVYFYLSMPLMIVTVIAAGCLAIYVFEQIGAIPVYIVLLIILMIIGTIIAVLRSLFVASEPDPVGEVVSRTAYPKLGALLDEVAATIGTRPVDVVYLVPGTDIAVMERTGLLRTILRQRSERRLLLGVAQFDGMTQLQLRSVLAHEYGHFRNEDTAGGGFAIAVRRSLFSLVERMATSGANTIYNPVWWFLRGFWRMYLGISQGASRLQEVLADRWAVRAYGSAAFVAGYRHVVARTVEFEHDLDAKIKQTLANKWSLANLYDWEPDDKKPADELTTEIEVAMNREPSPYDSHPSSRHRIDWAARHDVPREAQLGDDAPVWELFPDPEAIERAMTSFVRATIEKHHGVVISNTENEDVDGDDDVDGDEVGKDGDEVDKAGDEADAKTDGNSKAQAD